jgi:hypothetical protein
LTPKRGALGTGEELELIRRLRAVLKRTSGGMGVAAAFVGVFSGPRNTREREAVRRILLGTPVEAASTSLTRRSGPSGELLGFIATMSRFSSAEAGKGAEKLATMFDRWTLLKEKQAAEEKVMAFRGLVISVVAGVVVGMLGSLAPVLSTFQISLGAATAPQPVGFSPYEGAIFLVPSAVCLGSFLSKRRPYVNVLVALAAFAGVVYLMGPMTSFTLGP